MWDRTRRDLTAAACALCAAAGAGAAVAQDTSVTASDLRDACYCELIAVRMAGLELQATVYNTQGLNDCPAALWTALTPGIARRALGGIEVKMNGPRYWLMDAIEAEGATAAGETVTVGGLALTARATMEPGLSGLRQRPYTERHVDRGTQWIYRAGEPIFVLTGPDGTRYGMQSYAQIVDPALDYADLPDLGARLALPAGWSYGVWYPDTDLTNPSGGEAVIVQDELENTYQKLP